MQNEIENTTVELTADEYLAQQDAALLEASKAFAMAFAVGIEE